MNCIDLINQQMNTTLTPREREIIETIKETTFDWADELIEITEEDKTASKEFLRESKLLVNVYKLYVMKKTMLTLERPSFNKPVPIRRYKNVERHELLPEGIATFVADYNSTGERKPISCDNSWTAIVLNKLPAGRYLIEVVVCNKDATYEGCSLFTPRVLGRHLPGKTEGYYRNFHIRCYEAELIIPAAILNVGVEVESLYFFTEYSTSLKIKSVSVFTLDPSFLN